MILKVFYLIIISIIDHEQDSSLNKLYEKYFNLKANPRNNYIYIIIYTYTCLYVCMLAYNKRQNG